MSFSFFKKEEDGCSAVSICSNARESKGNGKKTYLCYDLQFFGGRGGSSGMDGRSSSVKYTISDYMRTLSRWTNENESINTKDRDVLEEFISVRSKEMGPVKYAYGLNRGVSMSDSELNALHEGGTFAEGKLASWTGQIGQAQSFAKNNTSSSKPNKVIVRTKSPVDQAVKLAGLGFHNRFAEAETLVSSKASFKIDKIKRAKHDWQFTEVWVTPKGKS